MLKKLKQVVKILPGKSMKLTTNGLWVSAVGKFEAIKEISNDINKDHLIHIAPSDEILADYLFYILKKPLKALEKDSANQTIRKLTLLSVKNIEIPVPSIDKQKKILESKNMERRIQKFWLESGVRTYEEPLKIDMSFEELLRLMATAKK